LVYQSMGSGCLPKCPQIRRCRLVILATVCSAIRSWSFGLIHSWPNRRITDLQTLPPLLGATPYHRLQGKIAASPALASSCLVQLRTTSYGNVTRHALDRTEQPGHAAPKDHKRPTSAITVRSH
jgi:hypothetical protein